MNFCILIVLILLAWVSVFEARSLRAERDIGCNLTAAQWNFELCISQQDIQPLSGNALSMPIMAAVSVGAGIGAMTAEASPGRIGLSTGGQQDIENFRENFQDGYLPLPTDVSFNGIIKDYYFNINGTTCGEDEAFCPTYSVALAPNPLNPEGASLDTFVSVGLDSGLSASEVTRKPLNLVILLDYSGSMASPFDQYYYDFETGVEKELTEEDMSKTKMDVAKGVMNGILDLLNEGTDKVAITLFETSSCTPKALGDVKCADLEALQQSILEDIQPAGSTNMAQGYDDATKQLKDCKQCMEAGLQNAENRIILITDAQPNSGDWTEQGFLARLKANAADNIFTTVVGVGLDFNTELIQSITQDVKGANYFSVHSPGDFQEKLVEDFEYAVNPLLFDINLTIDSDSLTRGWKIASVYGAPNAGEAVSSGGDVLTINTLFPSPKTEQGIKGGVLLLRMIPPDDVHASPLTLTVTYEDRNGTQHTSQRAVSFPADMSSELYGSPGVEKAVLLARYTDLIQSWLLDEWGAESDGESSEEPIVIPSYICNQGFPQTVCPSTEDNSTDLQVEAFDGEGGCVLRGEYVNPQCILPVQPIIGGPLLGKWERRSETLRTSENTKQVIRTFLPWFLSEIEKVGDGSLKQEADTLNAILNA